MKAVVNLDTCGRFYDFLVENEMEFIVDGLGEKDSGEMEKELKRQTTKVITSLIFKGKMKELLCIMTDTQGEYGKATLKEIREIINDFFFDMQELSNGSLMCLLRVPQEG